MTFKDIDYEINRLQNIKEQVIWFNWFVKSIPNAVAITQYRYDELSCQNLLNENTLYCVCTNDIAQYIDECMT